MERQYDILKTGNVSQVMDALKKLPYGMRCRFRVGRESEEIPMGTVGDAVLTFVLENVNFQGMRDEVVMVFEEMMEEARRMSRMAHRDVRFDEEKMGNVLGILGGFRQYCMRNSVMTEKFDTMSVPNGRDEMCHLIVAAIIQRLKSSGRGKLSNYTLNMKTLRNAFYPGSMKEEMKVEMKEEKKVNDIDSMSEFPSLSNSASGSANVSEIHWHGNVVMRSSVKCEEEKEEKKEEKRSECLRQEMTESLVEKVFRPMSKLRTKKFEKKVTLSSSLEDEMEEEEEYNMLDCLDVERFQEYDDDEEKTVKCEGNDWDEEDEEDDEEEENEDEWEDLNQEYITRKGL